MSLPGPPRRMSFPPWPSSVSAPPSPQSTSWPGVPMRMSGPGVPVTVQGARLFGAAWPPRTATSAAIANSAARVLMRFSRSGDMGRHLRFRIGAGRYALSGPQRNRPTGAGRSSLAAVIRLELGRAVRDANVHLVVCPALLLDCDLPGSALAAPIHLRVVLIELVMGDLVPGSALQLPLERVVGSLELAVEIAQDDVSRAGGALLREVASAICGKPAGSFTDPVSAEPLQT